jgi:hypothetical protein
LWSASEWIPCATTGDEEGFIIFKDTIRPVMRSQPVPELLDRIEIWGKRRQMKQGKIRRYGEVSGGMLGRAIQDPDGMSRRRDDLGDFVYGNSE